MNKKMNDVGTPSTACKQIKRSVNTVLSPKGEKLSFYINAKGKGVIADPNILKSLDPFQAAVCTVLIKNGSLILEGE